MAPSKRKVILNVLVLCAVLFGAQLYFLPCYAALALTPLTFLTAVMLAELWFRRSHKIFLGGPYEMLPKPLDMAKITFEPHPYLPFVRKKNFISPDGVTKTNNLRNRNGRDSARQVVIPKPPGLFRVHCLGASTTAWYTGEGEELTSYPLELEAILRRRFPQMDLEVNNCATPSHNSAEILVQFLLDSFDAQPDVVTIYHAFNDVYAYLTPGFQRDYSHYRRHMSEEVERAHLANLLPRLPLQSYDFLLRQILGNRMAKTDFDASVTQGAFDASLDFAGLATYRRNLEHIINVCQGNGIQVVLSSFCLFLDEKAARDPVQCKFREGVRQENAVMAELAQKHGLPLVDNDALIIKNSTYFQDLLHFTPAGMREIAKNLAGPIIEYIETKSGPADSA